MNRDDVDVVDRSTVFQGYFRVDRYRLKHRLFEGGWTGEMAREIFERGHAVAVLLYDPGEDCLVFIEQFRTGALAAIEAGYLDDSATPWLVECVAGIVETDELPEDVARREVKEETGCEVQEIIPVHRYLVSPGGTSEMVHSFCARVEAPIDGGIHGLIEEHEDIRIVVIPVREAFDRLQSGKISNGMTLIAMQWFHGKHEELRRLWAR